MNNPYRGKHTYQLTGTIYRRERGQASPKSKKYGGQVFYKLSISQPGWPQRVIHVFANKLLNPELWEIITQRQSPCLNKQYLFTCRNNRGYYYLLDWEEIPQEATEKSTEPEAQKEVAP